MSYFTILHWVALVACLIIFIFISILALRLNNKKIALIALLVNFTIIIMVALFSMSALDKYTKIAKLGKVKQKRILRTESLTLSGTVMNIGNFDIPKCTFEVKLVNNGSSGLSGADPDGFKPSGLSFFSFKKKKSKPTIIINKFIIVKNFKKGSLKNFSVSMKYPPYLKQPLMKYKLYCR